MKILIISDLFPLVLDNSIPSVVKLFSIGLKCMDNEIAIIRPNFIINSLIRNHKILKQNKYIIDNIEIYNRNFILPFVFENRKFIDFIKKQNFDLIISHMPSGHIYADLINKNLKIPHISIIHQSDYTVLNNFKYRFYFKNRLSKAIKNSTLIGARNKFLAEKLNADFILPSFIEKDKIINKKEFKNKKLKIITLSKLIKRKNIDLVIKALKNVDFDFEYSIYGEGKQKKYLEKLINKYDLKDKIKIYPFIKHNKIYDKLDENDVFILPSINETFGLSYLEAMSRGLITIGVKNTGIDGVIENNKNGFLIEPKVDEISKKLNEIFYLETKKKQEISSNTINSIKNNYTKEKVIEEYFKKIKSI